jgi:hypothetical protein
MRRLLAPLLALSLLIGAGAAIPRDKTEFWPEIWFKPQSPLDWLNMWTDDAPWQLAANRVNVLGVIHWWLLGATDEQILAMFDFAQRHHMKVEMETEVITRYANQPCGLIEGYTPPGAIASEMAILKRLNLHLDILTMDEPVWDGHYFPDPQNCYLSIPDLVDRIKSNIAPVLAQYPDIQIVEIEPIPGVTNFPDWKTTETWFRTALTEATGKPIRDIQLDVDWQSPGWAQPMREMREFTHQQSMGLGMYFNGFAYARSDAEWINYAIQHMETVEGAMGIIPEQVIFATWGVYPAYNMPETSPTTQTWLIDRYFRKRTMLQVEFVGQGVQGRLTEVDGRPVANATVNAYVPGVDFSLPLPATVVQDTVPATAAFGLIAIRLNAECLCQGVNDVLIGPIQYQETQGGSASSSYQYPTAPSLFNGSIVGGEWVAGSTVTRVITTPTQSFYPNSNLFPVTPSANFTFTVPASTIGGEGWYGHVLLLWFDQNINEVGNIEIVPNAGKRLMSTTTTAADGTFALSKLPRIGPGSAPVTVEFAGDDTYRAIVWSPLQQ